jgi:hypothetical protein
MKTKRLQTASLAEAMKAMKIGETCQPPMGYKASSVRTRCSVLRDEGYRFRVCRTDNNDVLITRLK